MGIIFFERQFYMEKIKSMWTNSSMIQSQVFMLRIRQKKNHLAWSLSLTAFEGFTVIITSNSSRSSASVNDIIYCWLVSTLMSR